MLTCEAVIKNFSREGLRANDRLLYRSRLLKASSSQLT